MRPLSLPKKTLAVAALLSLGLASARVLERPVANDLELPAGVKNTQPGDDQPSSPSQSAKLFSLPPGFEVSLFAGEPHVRQPISFCFDARGRLWVAECYSYRHWKPEGNDRILILEDVDGDGEFDKRTVFWSKGNYLSGIQVGFGGVWVCSAPHLLFIPDKDGDDRPDGPPVALLDGWSTKGVHNVLNGLTWGPDGWLYGLNGITAPSSVGKPGASDEQRVPVECAVWRYHPRRHEFEVVAHGTTNPWGLDFDLHGQGFFTNCVIGHLWHLIPGARYQRMFGEDLNPHSYQLLGSCSDHLHWTGDDWTKSRGGGEHGASGGGHAHCGAMIYYGDNWPDRFRGSIYTCNLHGARINNDTLHRQGAGFVGRHAPDLLATSDPWFRGVELKYGPDGGVFVTDWCDLGECHDTDGIHLTSGRIFKFTHGKPQPVIGLNLHRESDLELVERLSHKNQWFVRMAQRLLQERSQERSVDDRAIQRLRSQLATENRSVTSRLRALWTLHATKNLPPPQLTSLLRDADGSIRQWALRLLREDRGRLGGLTADLALLAKRDDEPAVRLELASLLQDLPTEKRWGIAEALASHAGDAGDANLPLMIWYGVEPAVAADPLRGVQFLAACKISLLRQFVARRLAEMK